MKKFYKKLAIILFLFLSFLTIVYQKTYLNKLFRENKYKKTVKIPENSEWEILNENVFFKRSAAFYYVEKSLLKILFISRSKIKFKPSYQIDLYSFNTHLSRLNQTSIHVLNRNSLYEFGSLDATLNKSQVFNGIVEEFSLHIRDSNGSYTNYPIQVKIKYENKHKSSHLICTKCYEIDSENYQYYLKDLEWWIELNKQIGYDRIILCNNSIPNNKKFNQLFNKYDKLVEIVQMNFLPSFFNNSMQFMRKNSEIKSYTNDYYGFRNIFEIFSYNECYLNNKNHYKYISVVDTDETIIPTKLKNEYSFISNLKLSKCDDDLKCLKQTIKLCNSSKNLESYLKQIDKNNKSISFKMGYYLRDETIEKLFDSFENVLKNKSIKIIKIKDYDLSYDYTFRISNQTDLQYLENLYKLYKILVKNKLIKKELNGNQRKKELDLYMNRVFYLAGDVTAASFGKTIHNTDYTLAVTNHYPQFQKVNKIDYNLGHVAHFRGAYTYAFKKTEIPIFNLKLNIEYLNCYYDNILKLFY